MRNNQKFKTSSKYLNTKESKLIVKDLLHEKTKMEKKTGQFYECTGSLEKVAPWMEVMRAAEDEARAVETTEERRKYIRNTKTWLEELTAGTVGGNGKCISRDQTW